MGSWIYWVSDLRPILSHPNVVWGPAYNYFFSIWHWERWFTGNQEFWSYCQTLYTQTRIHPRKSDSENSQGFWDTNKSSNSIQKTRLRVNWLKKRSVTCHLVDSSRHRVKIKESKMINKYLNFVRELKKLLNMRVTVILMVFGVLEMVSKDLERRLEELEIRKRIKIIEQNGLLLMRQTEELIT